MSKDKDPADNAGEAFEEVGDLPVPKDKGQKDKWDKWDIIGKLLIPFVIAAATFGFNASQNKRGATQKTLEVAIDILKAPQSAETEQLRNWALEILRREAKTASAELPSGAVKELQQGTPLPSTSQLKLPHPGPMRISIIRPQGTSAEQSEKLKSDLAAGSYTNVVTSERPQANFPSNPEVRYYYPEDKVNADALSDYISTQLHISNQSKDKTTDPGAASHSPGELHVYIK